MALGMSVRRAQQEIDSSEFAEWIAYDRLDPYGPERADLNAAIIAREVALPNMKKGAKITPADFMPKYGRRPERQTVSQMRANFAMFAAAHNGRNARNGKAPSDH